MTGFDPREAFSTPADNPLVPRLPIRLRDTEIFTVVYESDAAAVAEVVPRPLKPVGTRVLVQLYRMHDAEWFGRYGESAVQVPVRGPDGIEGVYSPYLFLESDGAVAAGREIYGQAKKGGCVSILPRGDLLVGRVRRNGIDLVTATMAYKQSAADPSALESEVPSFATNLNLKALPEVDGSPLALQLTARTLSDVVVHESWAGPATLELRPNTQAPVDRLPVRRVTRGFHWRCDLTLPFGRVVHDYLAEAAV